MLKSARGSSLSLSLSTSTSTSLTLSAKTTMPAAPTSSALRAVVVGAGAWGLPAAAELARRGCFVTLVDALEGEKRKTLGSSAGPTRIWRLAHPDSTRVRLARRAVEAWRRLERDALGRDGMHKIAVTRGILWRDAEEPLAAVAGALGGEGVSFSEVSANSVGSFFPGMAADSRDALFQPEAGIVMAEEAMGAHWELFARAVKGGSGGSVVSGGERVVEVLLGGGGGGGGSDDARSLRSFSSSSSSSAPVTVLTDRGRAIEADVVVLAPGTGATELSELIRYSSSSPSPSPSSSSSSSSASEDDSIFPRAVSALMRPRMQQTAHVSRPHFTDALPCWYDGPREVSLTEEEEEEERKRGREEEERGGATATRKSKSERRSKKLYPGLYAMPTPGIGYKIGLDAPVRFIGGEREGETEEEEEAFEPRVASDDLSREPSERANAAIEARIQQSLPGLFDSARREQQLKNENADSIVHSAQVCTWTDSPDGRFVVDALAGGRVVVAAGCSGEGFKFSALMGVVLADLAQGKEADEDVASFGLRRFEGMLKDEERRAKKRHVLGR